MNAASCGFTSAANGPANFAPSRKQNPSCGRKMDGTGDPGTGFLIKQATDSPASAHVFVLPQSPIRCSSRTDVIGLFLEQEATPQCIDQGFIHSANLP